MKKTIYILFYIWLFLLMAFILYKYFPIRAEQAQQIKFFKYLELIIRDETGELITGLKDNDIIFYDVACLQEKRPVDCEIYFSSKELFKGFYRFTFYKQLKLVGLYIRGVRQDWFGEQFIGVYE